ncbi:MAG: xanthine dehydrogenase family protein molybdopterin-binding subunit [Betaproteobacteria bacterium]|nr:MAG: xanthine dehydrogenase family protein molybdopterin-binding subunit [Betaproteobacteria bacterium]
MQSLLRTEDARLITGQGRFVHNIEPAGTLFAAFVRCDAANVSFELDFSAAKAMPAVMRIFTAADMPSLTMPAFNPLLKASRVQASRLLADGRTAYSGEAIALVVASDRASARAAAESVRLSSSTNAAAITAPLFEVHHRVASTRQSQTDDIAVGIKHTQARVQAMSMEPRASIARWDDAAQTLTFWTGTQAVARARDMLCQLLGLRREQVRVIAPDVGGAFGAKASLYPEDFVLAFAAISLRGCIKWTSTRSEEFLSATQGRGASMQGSLVVGRDGCFHQLTARYEFPLGAWLPYSAPVPLRNATRISPGPYRIDAIDIGGSASMSQHAATNIYRGAGRPEAALLMERLVDLAARQTNIDPVQLRRQNLIPASAMPYRTPTGETLDSGDYGKALDTACATFAYEHARRTQLQRRAQGELVGIGVACYIEPCGQGWESARVTLHGDGRVEVASGSSAQGQGHETSYAAIAADVLQIDATTITVAHGDTACAPDGIGALASRSMAIGGSAVLQAATQAKARLDAGEALPIVVDVRYTAPSEAWSYGCVMTQISVDRDTGAAVIERIVWTDDCGHIVSPILAKGQLLGGLAQGLGQAMMEAINYDEHGQLSTGSLMDYAVPRATDMPPITVVSVAGSTSANALGAKGVGEAGCIGVPAALLNAACDALIDFETTELSFPLTSETLWRVLQTRKESSQ